MSRWRAEERQLYRTIPAEIFWVDAQKLRWVKSWAKVDHNQEPWLASIEGQGRRNTQGVVRAEAGQNLGSRWLWSGGSRQAAIEDLGGQGSLRNEKVGVVW